MVKVPEPHEPTGSWRWSRAANRKDPPTGVLAAGVVNLVRRRGGAARTAAAQLRRVGLDELRAGEAPQDQALIAEAFTAAALGQPAAALRHARTALNHADALGIGHEFLQWAAAARAARDLADTATTTELLDHAAQSRDPERARADGSANANTGRRHATECSSCITSSACCVFADATQFPLRAGLDRDFPVAARCAGAEPEEPDLEGASAARLLPAGGRQLQWPAPDQRWPRDVSAGQGGSAEP